MSVVEDLIDQYLAATYAFPAGESVVQTETYREWRTVLGYSLFVGPLVPSRFPTFSQTDVTEYSTELRVGDGLAGVESDLAFMELTKDSTARVTLLSASGFTISKTDRQLTLLGGPLINTLPRGLEMELDVSASGEYQFDIDADSVLAGSGYFTLNSEFTLHEPVMFTLASGEYTLTDQSELLDWSESGGVVTLGSSGGTGLRAAILLSEGQPRTDQSLTTSNSFGNNARFWQVDALNPLSVTWLNPIGHQRGQMPPGAVIESAHLVLTPSNGSGLFLTVSGDEVPPVPISSIPGSYYFDITEYVQAAADNLSVSLDMTLKSPIADFGRGPREDVRKWDIPLGVLIRYNLAPTTEEVDTGTYVAPEQPSEPDQYVSCVMRLEDEIGEPVKAHPITLHVSKLSDPEDEASQLRIYDPYTGIAAGVGEELDRLVSLTDVQGYVRPMVASPASSDIYKQISGLQQTDFSYDLPSYPSVGIIDVDSNVWVRLKPLMKTELGVSPYQSPEGGFIRIRLQNHAVRGTIKAVTSDGQAMREFGTGLRLGIDFTVDQLPYGFFAYDKQTASLLISDPDIRLVNLTYEVQPFTVKADDQGRPRRLVPATGLQSLTGDLTNTLRLYPDIVLYLHGQYDSLQRTAELVFTNPLSKMELARAYHDRLPDAD